MLVSELLSVCNFSQRRKELPSVDQAMHRLKFVASAMGKLQTRACQADHMVAEIYYCFWAAAQARPLCPGRSQSHGAPGLSLHSCRMLGRASPASQATISASRMQYPIDGAYSSLSPMYVPTCECN